MNIVAVTVTGDNSPSGSNTLDDSFNTSLFVTSEVILGMGDLDVRCRVSACVSHCSTKTLTGLFVSATLSLVACSVSR